MKKTRFTEEQMVSILREADQRPVPEVAKKHGVSAQTIYGWRKHFGTLEPVDVKRLRQLETENGRLKKMVADRDLELDVLKEITRKKWYAHACAGSRLRMHDHAACRAAARAPYSRSRARLCPTFRRSPCAMRPSWPRCASSPASIPDTATGRFGSSWVGADTR
jgi:putative transposase